MHWEKQNKHECTRILGCERKSDDSTRNRDWRGVCSTDGACPPKTIIDIQPVLRRLIRHLASKSASAMLNHFRLTLEVVMAQRLPFRPGIKYAGSPAETVLIAICCVCGLVRARKTFTSESDRWITCRAYEQRYGVALMGSALTHTYCSGCYTDFMQRVRHTRQATAPLST